jgi:hypothetical protein
MKRIVRSDAALGAACGLVASLIVWLTHASLGASYLILLAVIVIGFIIAIGPERGQLWREMRGLPPTERPRR